MKINKKVIPSIVGSTSLVGAVVTAPLTIASCDERGCSLIINSYNEVRSWSQNLLVNDRNIININTDKNLTSLEDFNNTAAKMINVSNIVNGYIFQINYWIEQMIANELLKVEYIESMKLEINDLSYNKGVYFEKMDFKIKLTNDATKILGLQTLFHTTYASKLGKLTSLIPSNDKEIHLAEFGNNSITYNQTENFGLNNQNFGEIVTRQFTSLSLFLDPNDIGTINFLE